ncbi:hypothetical protein EJJ20_12875 [Pseudomonas poae]|nr:hypothetical protein EJJ20_12875 [Pseudomonas poae]
MSRSMAWKSSTSAASTRRPRAFSKKPVARSAARKSARRCSKAWKTGCPATPTTSPARCVGMKMTSTGFFSCRNAGFPTWDSFSTTGRRRGSSRALSTNLPIGWIRR